MIGAGLLEPRFTGSVDADRFVIDLAPYLARKDVGVDESRRGVTVRGRFPLRGESTMWVTRRFPGRFGIGSSAPTVTVSRTGALCVLPVVGAAVRSVPLVPECCARAACSAKPPPTISTTNR